jgi:hypothetical protein
MRFLRIAVLILSTSPVLVGQQAHYKKHDGVLLPDPEVTPGVLANISEENVCSTKWGKDERHVTSKKAIFVQYGTANGKGVCAYKTHTGTKGQKVKEGCEIDHLISRELGGADDPANLWPQPYTQHPGAHEKDWLENLLHKEVCELHTLTLKEAQDEIKKDWYAAFLKRKDQWDVAQAKKKKRLTSNDSSGAAK